VAHITALAAAGYVDWSKATYSNRLIPNLFSDATLMPQSYAKVTPPGKPTQRLASNDPLEVQGQSPVQEIADLINSLGIQTVFPTVEDMNAISKMNPL
jgi:hypothetical protein